MTADERLIAGMATTSAPAAAAMAMASLKDAELEVLRQLVIDAYPVMVSHAARHERKAGRPQETPEHIRSMHQRKCDRSNSWLERATQVINEAHTR